MERTATSCLEKFERMNKALRHEEPDPMPISNFSWESFVKRWLKYLVLADSVEHYSDCDLDWIAITSNMDQWIIKTRQFQ